MKKLILFLSIIALSQSAFSQKKDLFTFADLVKKFRLSDTTVKNYIHADSILRWVRTTYDLKGYRAEHPDNHKDAQFVIYEFYFKDNTNLYLLVRPDFFVTEITHRYNCQGRTAEFTTWTAATKNISKGKL